MSISFQPKIIIGSVVGFIATAIGVIAVFFPSLFNLETKKISEFNNTLKTEENYKNFVDFLISHQGEIVKLDIKYYENERYFNNTKETNGVYETEKEDLNSEGSYEPLTGEGGYGIIDDKGRILVFSDFFRGQKFMSFIRYGGGFFIWLPTTADDNRQSDSWIVGADQRDKHVKDYMILILKNSENNTLYKWNVINPKNNINEMQLSGNFFIKKMVNTSEYKEPGRVVASEQWMDKFCNSDEGICKDMNIIELDPLSEKDIEFKKY